MRVTSRLHRPHHPRRLVVRQREDDEAKDDNDRSEDSDKNGDNSPTRTSRPVTRPTDRPDADDDEAATTTRRTSTTTRRSTSTTSKGAKPTGKGKSTASGARATPTLPASSHPESSSTRALIGIGASIGAVLVVAVGLWFLRKYYIRKHAATNAAWRASMHDQLDLKREAIAAPATVSVAEKDTGSLRPLMSDEKVVDTPVSPTFKPPALPAAAGIPESLRPTISPPNAAIGPLISVSVTSPQTPKGAVSPALSPLSTQPATAGVKREAAMVVRSFVPTLVDELPVTIGDTVFIIEAFTDGWCSCETSAGQSGVVPLECLQSMSRPNRGQSLAQQDGGDWRSSKRHSSLYGGMRQSETY